MSSLFTNNAAMTAQLTLKLIGQNLDKTNDVISTGLKIAGASDNAAYWAIATQIRQDNASLGAVKDSIGQGLGVVNITYQALNTMVGELAEVKRKLTTASGVGVDRMLIQNDLNATISRFRAYAADASQAGESWLSVDSSQPTYAAIRKVVSGFTRVLGKPTLTTTDIDTAQLKLYDGKTTAGTNGTSATVGSVQTTYDTAKASYDAALAAYNSSGKDTAAVTAYTAAKASFDTATTTYNAARNTANAAAKVGNDGKGGILNKDYGVLGADNNGFLKAYTLNFDTMDISTVLPNDLSKVNAYVAMVERISSALTAVASNLGSLKAQMQSFQNYTDTLSKANDTSIGILVDGNMEEESTKLKALQVQQQLGIQSLTIANQNTQQILSLFRN
jgi:flagellin